MSYFIWSLNTSLTVCENEIFVCFQENDKNIRVPQAASNTVMEVDQKDVDNMLNISYLTGHSDSRLVLFKHFICSSTSRARRGSTLSSLLWRNTIKS